MSVHAIKDAILSVPIQQGRRIIAISGPPASGKSTLAEELQAEIHRYCVLPMDGFHYSNEDLEGAGILARKGAPETFDVTRFEAILQAVRTTSTVSFSTFDRSRDCVVPGGGIVNANDHTILVEGNYLLLDAAPWSRLLSLWDYTIMLDVPAATLEARLVQRWLDHGHNVADAQERVRSNDLPNALYTQRHSVKADQVISHH